MDDTRRWGIRGGLGGLWVGYQIKIPHLIFPIVTRYLSILFYYYLLYRWVKVGYRVCIIRLPSVFSPATRGQKEGVFSQTTRGWGIYTPPYPTSAFSPGGGVTPPPWHLLHQPESEPSDYKAFSRVASFSSPYHP